MFSDFSMNKALMDNATKQEWTPEWFFTGAGYADIGILARGYPQRAVEARVRPLVPHAVDRARPAAARPRCRCRRRSTRSTGTGASTPARSRARSSRRSLWLLAGIQAAGPNLTPKTFQQGLFAVPPSGGAAQNRTNSTLFGYGKGPKLPYDEYA